MLDYVPLSLGSLYRLGKEGGYWCVSWIVPKVPWDVTGTVLSCHPHFGVAALHLSPLGTGLTADCMEWPKFMSEFQVRLSSSPLPSKDSVRFVNFDAL